MRKSFFQIGTVVILTILFALTTDGHSQGESLGQFEEHADIGAPENAGDATYNTASHQYILSASGANMFGEHDEFHFVWLRLKGDFILQASIEFIGPGVDPHRKAGLMARSSLDHDASYVDGTIHGSGPTALQLRRSNGAETEMVVTTPGETGELTGTMKSSSQNSDFLQLERHGNTYIFSEERLGEPYTRSSVDEIDLGDDLYVGLFLCAHNPQVIEEAVFQNVRIIQTQLDH